MFVLISRAWATLIALALVLLATPQTAQRTTVAVQPIYDDAAAAGWQDYSWATVDFATSDPVYGGSRSIAVTYTTEWQGLYLYHPGYSTTGLTELRFFIHGGASGGQHIQLHVVRTDDSGDSHGRQIRLDPPQAGSWTEVTVALADLDAVDTIITGIIWQDARGAAQPTFYIDSIAFDGAPNTNAPTISAATVRPQAVAATSTNGALVRVAVADPQGRSDIARVTVTAAEAGNVELADDGLRHDGPAGDGIYGGLLMVAPDTPAGEYPLTATAVDQRGNSTNALLGTLVVLDQPGGTIPAGLPQRPAWGTNQWSEARGADWQVNSNVNWDYVYQYITYDWYVDGWNGDFVGRFVRQAWSKNFIPVVSVYLMLGTPPTCGESGACYAQKLQNPAAVSAYLAALAEAARQARGNQPVIFQLEPDFYGFMQQLSNRPDRPAGVVPDDPASFPVALAPDIVSQGYSANLAGFGQYLIDLVQTTAPNVLVAPHASMWATDQDPNTVTAAEVRALARRTAAFMNAMGGDRAALWFVEWSDRDAGSGLRPFWDVTNQTLPRISRAMLWKNALSAASGQRLILWQVPAGNMDLDDTCNRYRDNRAAYAFRHAGDLYTAGVIAVLFGGGAECMTQPSTDGGAIAGQAALAYTAPAAPSGLTITAAAGATISLRWNENTESDLRGYRVHYQRSGGEVLSRDLGLTNSASLLLPSAGDWQFSVVAYDQMGNISPAAGPLGATTTASPAGFLPLVHR